MVQYIKEDINKIKYWDTWKSTEFTYIILIVSTY